MIKLTADQSLVLCDIKCFLPSSSIGISIHLEKDAILVVKDDLAKIVFFFLHDYLDLADMSLLVNIEILSAVIDASLTI